MDDRPLPPPPPPAAAAAAAAADDPEGLEVAPDEWEGAESGDEAADEEGFQPGADSDPEDATTRARATPTPRRRAPTTGA